MQELHLVAEDAESTKVHCELKARRDAVKAERETRTAARGEGLRSERHIGRAGSAGAILAHLRWKWQTPEQW